MSEPVSTRAPRTTALVLAYGDEPVLVECVEAILSSEDVDVDVVLVDNGCTSGAVDELAGRPGITVVRPGENTGFAGGCNLAARHARGEVLVLVNGDAVVRPGAIAALSRAACLPGAGLATSSLRLYERPDHMNSAGNPVHYLGLSWAGGLGDPATAHAEPRDVASGSGAALAVRRDTWNDLDGFWEPMFAYCEDAELSLRCWQRGLTVRYVPDAVVLHRYEFSRNPTKNYLLERNRLLLLLTLLERRTLLAILPPLVGLELAIWAIAARQGWGRDKVRGWRWIWQHRREVRARRAEVQTARTRTDADLLPGLLTGRVTPGEDTGLSVPGPLNALAATYWSLVRRVVLR